MYLAYGVFYEGSGDAPYLDILIPRVIEEICIGHARSTVDVAPNPTVRFGTNGRSPGEVGREICAARNAIHIAFVHSDTGGRGQESQIEDRSDAYCAAAMESCDFPKERCICIRIRHEMEAWALADPDAVKSALGYSGELDLPRDAQSAERLPDPKAVFSAAVRQVRGRRHKSRDLIGLFPSIAQEQRLDTLKGSSSFRTFYNDVASGLAHLGIVEFP